MSDDDFEAEVQVGVAHVHKVHATLEQLCHRPHLTVLPQVDIWHAEGPPIEPF